MTNEKVDLGKGFYILTYEEKHVLGFNEDGKLYEINIPENVYRSLRRREGYKF